METSDTTKDKISSKKFILKFNIMLIPFKTPNSASFVDKKLILSRGIFVVAVN